MNFILFLSLQADKKLNKCYKFRIFLAATNSMKSGQIILKNFSFPESCSPKLGVNVKDEYEVYTNNHGKIYFNRKDQ